MIKQFIYVSLVVVIVVAAYSITQNIKGVGALPFGGKVVTSFPCPCSGNFLLTVSPPVGGQFVYYMGTQAHLNYNLPTPGVWALGLYSPGGVCLVPVTFGCAPVGIPIGTILPTVGTSLTF